jgi:aryl-alcohol dehydrogenase-like predicted oxidoreductase
MKYRQFGKTGLVVSEVGFGAWGIGGATKAGEVAIGWGETDDEVSKAALRKAYDQGVTFYDTADFYGLGHSEKLIGETFGDRDDVVIATKVGHVVENGGPALDYSKEHVIEGCEASLKRLRREAIDYYQLHSARLDHLRESGCVEAMTELKAQGKIRHWGISLNTFNPFPEADYFFDNEIGEGFQIVLNVINQRALTLIEEAGKRGYGVIARMPLQFGLLTGKFDEDATFAETDHRRGRLPRPILKMSLDALEDVWKIAEPYGIPKTSFALSFILNSPGVSTVIPGIKTPEQAVANTTDLVEIEKDDYEALKELWRTKLVNVLNEMEKRG